MSNYQPQSKMSFITTQSKLTKEEWTNIEVPCSDSEKRILSLIEDGYNDVNIRRNYTSSLARHIKITHPEKFGQYLYENYFQKHMDGLCKKYKQFCPALVEMLTILDKKVGGGGVGGGSNNHNKQPVLKKADIIRIENTSKNIDEHKHTIFEYILIELLEKMLAKKYLKKGTTGGKSASVSASTSSKEWLFQCYTIHRLLSYTVEDKNMILCSQLENIISYLVNESPRCIEEMLSQSYLLIEKNDYLLKHADETLYDHQKQLFSVCKNPSPKLVLYIAPTGTGKTMSPLGLSTNHRVIFVCAARHVGLSLAKAAISMHKKIAFAFGCNDAEDIRLHYFAAKEYTKNTKSGGIGKVDNTQGEKVEIMISDVQSYLSAMLYMLAFNPKEKIITYWDEPTIAMDYPEHELHAMITKNWTENLIPNMVLSSATLPQRNEIADTIMDFCGRFADVDVHEIISYDCKKTIPLLNREGFIEMPHYLHSEYAQVLEVVEHCKLHKTLLRYIDLNEAVKFILLVQRLQKDNTIIMNNRYTVETYFTDIDTLTMANIKLFYLDLLGNINPSAYPLIYNELCAVRKKAQESNVNIVTTDAHTLTDGPTIFLADDVHKIAQFYIQSAKIPDYVLKEVMNKIVFNRNLQEQIKTLEKDLEDATTSTTGDGTRKDKTTRDDKLSPELKEKKQKLNTLNASIQTIILTPTYVPNTRDHLYKYAAKMEHDNAFTCDISEETVEQIMRIMDVEDYWKLLLLMGIGVFAEHKSVRYTEVMKKLAQEQKLFMIIASSDYIYGTNYQFCHGYIGKDLGDMTQEKCIQSMGRVGRNKLQQNYSVRFRDNALIYKLFHRDDNKPEVENMNRLFNTL